jgi:hypothetical protein
MTVVTNSLLMIRMFVRVVLKDVKYAIQLMPVEDVTSVTN